MTAGFRIHERKSKVESVLVEGLAGVATSGFPVRDAATTASKRSMHGKLRHALPENPGRRSWTLLKTFPLSFFVIPSG